MVAKIKLLMINFSHTNNKTIGFKALGGISIYSQESLKLLGGSDIELRVCFLQNVPSFIVGQN